LGFGVDHQPPPILATPGTRRCEPDNDPLEPQGAFHFREHANTINMQRPCAFVLSIMQPVKARKLMPRFASLSTSRDRPRVVRHNST
jgi:hypothetical protein